MLKIIRKIHVNPARQIHVDTSYNRYVLECGDMLYELAVAYQGKADYNKAIQIFSTATSFKWPGRGRCFLELAKLNIHTPLESIKFADKALESEYRFKPKEKIELLNLKLKAYRRLGPRYRQKVKELYQHIINLKSVGT